MNLDLILSAFILGMLGAGHCIGMCGGISSALTFAIGGNNSAGIKRAKSQLSRFKIIFAYNFGRILSYVVIGSFISWIASWLQVLGFPYFRIIAGVLMILMGFYLLGIWKLLLVLERGGQLIWRYIQPLGTRLMPVRTAGSALALGSLWGWLPCGLVYTATSYSAAQANPLAGGLVMLAFGLGTLPAVVSSGLIADHLKAILRGRAFRYFSAAAMIVFGLWTVYGAMVHSSIHQHHLSEAMYDGNAAIAQIPIIRYFKSIDIPG